MAKLLEKWRERPDPPVEKPLPKKEVPWQEDSAFEWPEWYMEETLQKKVERIVREKFYTGPLSGATERLAKALIEEFKLNDENMGNC